MSIKTESEALRQAVAWCAAAIPSVPPVPAMSGVRFDADGEGLTLTATDFRLVAVDSLEAAGEQHSCILPAAPLKAFLAAVRDGESMTLEPQDGQVRIATRQGHITLRTLAMEEWPERLPGAEGDVEVKGLADALAVTATCASRDDSRPTLMGVHLAGDGSVLRLQASDSYTAHQRRLDADLEADIILPLAAAQRAAKAGAGSVAVERGFASLGCEGRKWLHTSGVQGEFPDVDKHAYPSGDPQGVLTVHVDELTTAVVLASPTANPLENGGAMLSLTTEGSEVLVASADSQAGSGEARAACSHDGQQVQFSVASKRLLTTAKAAADEEGWVSIAWRDEVKPLVMTPVDPTGDDRRSLCMPIRI